MRHMVREITITPVLNGFVCKVGCQKVVFQSIAEMTQKIQEYYEHPEVVEKVFLAKAVNKMADGPQVVEAPRACEEACDRQTQPMGGTSVQESRR